jgi:hypothetical protein
MIISEFIFNGRKISISRNYCNEYNAYRYSYSIGSTHHNMGYGINNEILYKTETDAMLSAIEQLLNKEDFKIIKRDLLINSIL